MTEQFSGMGVVKTWHMWVLQRNEWGEVQDTKYTQFFKFFFVNANFLLTLELFLIKSFKNVL